MIVIVLGSREELTTALYIFKQGDGSGSYILLDLAGRLRVRFRSQISES